MFYSQIGSFHAVTRWLPKSPVFSRDFRDGVLPDSARTIHRRDSHWPNMMQLCIPWPITGERNGVMWLARPGAHAQPLIWRQRKSPPDLTHWEEKMGAFPKRKEVRPPTFCLYIYTHHTSVATVPIPECSPVQSLESATEPQVIYR